MSTQIHPIPRPDRPLLAIVAGILVLIVGGLVAVVVAGRLPAAPPPDPATPAGVVTSYIASLRAGDPERAYALLSRSARAAISQERFRRDYGSLQSGGNPQTRLQVETTRETADRAEVRVTITTFNVNDRPFSTSSYSQDWLIPLVYEDGLWRMNQPIDAFWLG